MTAYLRIPASKVGFGCKNSVGAWASPSVDDARARKVGIWGERFFWVRNAHEMQRDIDTFQIVEGRVISDVIIKGRAYLNFNQNWRTNFTFSISQPDRRHFERAGFDFAMLGSRRVRGRGWVTLGNGPLMRTDTSRTTRVIRRINHSTLSAAPSTHSTNVGSTAERIAQSRGAKVFRPYRSRSTLGAPNFFGLLAMMGLLAILAMLAGCSVYLAYGHLSFTTLISSDK